MSETNRHLPDTADRQLVRFHCDYDSPGGFIGTISQDPDPDVDPGFGMWMFYADEHLIARGENVAPGTWSVSIHDPGFVAAQKITDRQLQDLFERGSEAPNGPYEVLVQSAAGDTAPSIACAAAGPKPNALRAAPDKGFRLSRTVLAESVDAESEADANTGSPRFGETSAERIAGAVMHAELAKALTIPDGLQLEVFKLVAEADAVVLAIRETHEAAAGMFERRRAAGLPVERQLATWHIEGAWLLGGDDGTFGGMCVMLEEVCTIANGLVPSLRALLTGEEMLLALLAEPLTVLTYNLRAQLGRYRTSVDGLTERDAGQTRDLWPLLIETLERGEASEDWDGDRQRAFQLEAGGARHLARQLADARTALVQAGTATLETLPEPVGGFAAHLA